MNEPRPSASRRIISTLDTPDFAPNVRSKSDTRIGFASDNRLERLILDGNELPTGYDCDEKQRYPGGYEEKNLIWQ